MRLLNRHSILAFLITSLVLHAFFWGGLEWVKPNASETKHSPIEIVVLDESQTRNQAEKTRQIVEQPKQRFNDETPDDAKYLSQFNQRVVKETRAREHGDFRNSAGHGGPLPQPAMAAQPKPQKSSAQQKLDRGTLPSLKSFSPKFELGAERRDLARTEAANPTAGGGPASQTNDHLKDTEQSLETLLNTREFVYYTYYQRIRAQIRQYWEPSIREKVRRILSQGRTIASERDHVTRVVIILDKSGALLRVQVVGQSGVSDLDDAAVDAFRAAEPFPNPPKGIIEADGTIRINWDFILEA